MVAAVAAFSLSARTWLGSLAWSAHTPSPLTIYTYSLTLLTRAVFVCQSASRESKDIHPIVVEVGPNDSGRRALEEGCGIQFTEQSHFAWLAPF